MSENTRLTAWRLGIIFAVVIVAESAVRLGWISSFFLAAPTRAAVVLWEQIVRGNALWLTGITLFEIAACLVISTVLRRTRRVLPLALQAYRHQLRDVSRGAVLFSGHSRLSDLSRYLRPDQRRRHRAVFDLRLDPDHHQHQRRLPERQSDPAPSRRQHESHPQADVPAYSRFPPWRRRSSAAFGSR